MSNSPDSPVGWVERLTKLGWLSKGLVFVVVGILTGRIATQRWDRSGTEVNQEGALRAVAAQPLGAVLLTAIATGLVVFMIWNIAQAVVPGSTDIDPLGLAKRAGWFGLGLFYGLVAFVGFRLAWREADSPSAGTDASTGSGSGGGASESSPQAITARLLGAPGGRWVAVLIAAGVLAVAGYQLYKGVTYRFVDDLDTDELSDRHQRWLGRLGVGGFAARGFVLAVLAWFLFKAAIEFDPNDAVGLDGALRELASVTYGRLILLLVGGGLALAGVYDMVTFRHQQLR